ncbi:hypothetical protein A9W98_04765 [Mycobacterium gordonae]|uniref:Uncharacterized protein n=2 Tax=Mycobacteriaceae TaxID=1762 RepID=G8RLK1_MYCRN|nr:MULTISPECIES: hypothetical protein [Mycobacteriaceae]AEV73633.1 hypothetical protein MycrhN_3098 [Mycolicibacterium rhodesiae NBB3]OBR97915.1 hypothetical protein A9W98_04765 [Mycobacterium gordonae]
MSTTEIWRAVGFLADCWSKSQKVTPVREELSLDLDSEEATPCLRALALRDPQSITKMPFHVHKAFPHMGIGISQRDRALAANSAAVELAFFHLTWWIRSRLPGYPHIPAPQLAKGSFHTLNNFTVPWAPQVLQAGIEYQDRPVNCDFQLKISADDRYSVLAEAFEELPSWRAFTQAHHALGQEIRNELLTARQQLARQAAAAGAESGIEFGDPREGLNRARSVTMQTLETLSPEARRFAESFESVNEEIDRITTAVLTQLVAYGPPETLTGVSELTVSPSSPPTVSFKLLDAGYAGGIYWTDDPLIGDAILLECFRFAGDNVFATRFHADGTVLLGTGAAWRAI